MLTWPGSCVSEGGGGKPANERGAAQVCWVGDVAMAAVDCIIKLGGSALTCKNQLETLKAESLQRAAAIVQKFCAAAAGEGRCIVVHGAG